ncbi:hypothetical protein IL306_000075 [Fusarium sp. DS 682]|nr:hypothetical protein IL306_000075 [Fusarium sp. DS 682]
MDPKDDVKILQKWYQEQRPLTVDIIGDFAGQELFVIHGESLMRHCLAEATVDFDGGFQLLHTVYAVEKFLHEFKRRGCNFDVIFFRDLKNICAPRISVKYDLTRRILIQHLAKSDLDFCTIEFDSVESKKCMHYMSGHAVHFMLCDDGRDGSPEQAIRLQHLIRKVITSGKHAALINSVTWRSSKVFMPLLSGTKNALRELSIDVPDLEMKEIPSLSQAVFLKTTQPPLRDADFPAREKHTVAFCRAYIDNCCPGYVVSEADLNRIEALLLQVATLRICSLQDRAQGETRVGDESLETRDHDFLHMFCAATEGVLEMSSELNEQEGWELFDLIDGRIFFHFLKLTRENGETSPKILEHAHILYTETTKGLNLDIWQPFTRLQPLKDSNYPPKALKDLSALAFSHPVLDNFMKDVKIKEAQETMDPATEFVFEDLKHWHAFKPVTNFKNREQVPAWLEKRRQKQMQWRMADVISYAASLTNSVGKSFNRETIVVNSRSNLKSTPSSMTKHPRLPKGPKQRPGGGGKQSALLEAQKLSDQKAQAKLKDILSLWYGKYSELEGTKSLIDRYLKALDFQSDRSAGSHVAIRPEIQLYLCYTLIRLWGQVRQRAHRDSSEGLYLISMIWNWLSEISRSPNCTPNVVNAVQDIVKVLTATKLPIEAGQSSRSLPFSINTECLIDASKLISDHRLLQLEHGGPYMGRRFDSKPDARVPFEPDAWQRDVLDSIDNNESVLVIAPTSAGKTFISFYAMKKVLEESDDGVLVYVAPTKALVNQIAAEIEARFSKSYHKQASKSIWAVHTRDYRINNPTQCQILVTVPHMLQIMLLAPTNAVGPSPWSQRVKRIIFDEVHCIGQVEDGVIWEQLLLLAPCPIIALSATIGNPHELKNWLAMSQAQKGYDMKMIVHGVRYSDLRKFRYDPPEEFTFKGVSTPLRLPVPGLDEGGGISPNFKFVHPVLALKYRNRSVLDDVNLEARDCLTLWKHMKKTIPSTLLLDTAQLDPIKTLPELIEKTHVIEWEKGLKSVLKRAMEMQDTAFTDLQKSLDDEKSTDQQHTRALNQHIKKLFPLACELQEQNALPALVFNYDRFDSIIREMEEGKGNGRVVKRYNTTEENLSKLDLVREGASVEINAWESFDPEAPLDQFSFAGAKTVQQTEFTNLVRSLSGDKVAPWLVDALRRGLGVHHAGMNRRYRQV